jgi:hypothetical protein
MSTTTGLFSSSEYKNSFSQWNSQFIHKTIDEEIVLDKFQYDTLVKLETGQTKNIQQLTTNDFLISTKQSPKYSGSEKKNNFFA